MLADSCEWSEWTAATKCSKTCGGGFLTKTRESDKPCPGPSIQIEHCNVEPCPGSYAKFK